MCCSCRCNCTLIGLAASVLLGVIAAFLAIAGTITVAASFGWVTLGIAVVYLAVALVAVPMAHHSCGSDCKCAALRALIAGVLSMALASLVVLAVGLVATSVVSALLIGWLVASLALTLVSTACLVSDLAGCN